MSGQYDVRDKMAGRADNCNTPLSESYVHEVVGDACECVADKRREEDQGHDSVAEIIVPFKL